MHLLRHFIVSHLDWHSQFRRLVMRSLQVIQLEDFNHSPFIFPVVFPFDQSFYLITSVTEITPLPSTVPGNTIVIYVVACSCPWSSTQVTLFWIPPILIFIHLPIYRTKLAWMAAFLHSFKSWYFLEAMPCTFSMLNTHSPCPNVFRMVIRYLNPPGCIAG